MKPLSTTRPGTVAASTSLRTDLGYPVERSSTGFTYVLAVLVSALREIFDESAYARFLHRTQIAPSREAYAAFCRECEAARARRPRCC